MNSLSKCGRRPNQRSAFPVRAFKVLGVRVDQLQIESTIDILESWIAARDGCHFIAVTGMHGVVEARHSAGFKRLLNDANLVVPDGMPLVWLGRLRGYPMRRRVYGPELMLSFCRRTAAKGYRHYFFGGTPGVPEQLAAILRSKIPSLRVAGTYSPPFRSVTPEEDDEIVSTINASVPDVLWVGLGTPKQEQWMYEHRDRLKVPVLVGVGAAFDFHVGLKKQAPRWMQEHGLEWFFRLVQEPKRLWRRYILYGTEFLFCVLLEELHLRKFE